MNFYFDAFYASSHTYKHTLISGCTQKHLASKCICTWRQHVFNAHMMLQCVSIFNILLEYTYMYVCICACTTHRCSSPVLVLYSLTWNNRKWPLEFPKFFNRQTYCCINRPPVSQSTWWGQSTVAHLFKTNHHSFHYYKLNVYTYHLCIYVYVHIYVYMYMYEHVYEKMQASRQVARVGVLKYS